MSQFEDAELEKMLKLAEESLRLHNECSEEIQRVSATASLRLHDECSEEMKRLEKRKDHVVSVQRAWMQRRTNMQRQELINTSILSDGELTARVKIRLPLHEAERVLSILEEHVITAETINAGLYHEELEELVSVVECDSVLLYDEAWRSKYTRWIDECLQSLLPDEIKGQPTIISNVKTALREAGLRSRAELERMSREDLEKCKSSNKARLYLGKDRVAGLGHLVTKNELRKLFDEFDKGQERCCSGFSSAVRWSSLWNYSFTFSCRFDLRSRR